MLREIKGKDTPDMHTRFYVGRCVATGVIHGIDLERACEIVLTIRQMSLLAKHACVFGLTDSGDMSVGTSEQEMRGHYIILSLRNLQMQGCMSDDFDDAFQRFLRLLQISFSPKKM